MKARLWDALVAGFADAADLSAQVKKLKLADLISQIKGGGRKPCTNGIP